MYRSVKLQWLFIFLALFACQSEKQKPSSAVEANPVSVARPESPMALEPKPVLDTSQHNHYSWLSNYDPAQSLINRIALPSGYQRKAVGKGSFADWLRYLPLKPEQSAVRLYNGQLKTNQKVHAGVLDIDVGKRDLQQCADAVMRLKAEYHYSKKEYPQIHFNYTSGDRVAFQDWAKGKKPIIRGNRVDFSPAGSNTDFSYANFRKYLIQIFNYAGTASLSKELKKVSAKDIQAGDVFIQGGFPGHAIIVLDVASNAAGETIFLVGQSYMPAQDIHVLKNWNEEGLSPWYKSEALSQMLSPEWTFDWSDLKRFQD